MSDPVVKTDGAASPAPEAKDAQDLDTLLNEYDAAKPEPQKTDARPEGDVAELVSYVKEQQKRDIQEQTQRDIKSSVEKIKDGLDIKVPDSAIRGILFDKAESDPRFLKAWSERGTNPKGFEKVLKALQAEIKAEFADAPDKAITDDREALASAVRGANTSTTKDEPQDFDKKVRSASDREFNKMLKEMGL